MRLAAKGLILLALGALGLGMAFWPMVSSGLNLMQTDPGDTRHLNYVLEHDYRWAIGSTGHRDLWSPPMFYPEPNTAAYSEMLLGVAPVYAVFRLAGALPDTSLQLFMLTCALLNFLAAYLLFARALRMRFVPSLAGAFLFAYGSVRTVQIGHEQLIPQFFSVMTVGALAMMVREDQPPRTRAAWIAVFYAGMVGQVYACLYLAWLLSFGLLALGAVAIAFSDVRHRVVAMVRSQVPAIVLGAVASAFLVLPLMRHYLEASKLVGMRDFSNTALLLPGPLFWLFQGHTSWLYGALGQWPVFHDAPFEWEKRLGLGLATTTLVLAGFWSGRRNRAIRITALASGVVVLCVTLFPGGVTIWRVLFEILPGAKAIRAVSRIGLVLLIPAGWGLALAFERLLSSRRGMVLAAMLAAVVVAEQGQSMPAYSKNDMRQRITAVSSLVPSTCSIFFYASREQSQAVWESQLDGMWAGLQTGIPTINGYSSNFPPGWTPLLDNILRSDGREREIRALLEDWVVVRGVQPETVCLVVGGPPGATAPASR